MYTEQFLKQVSLDEGRKTDRRYTEQTTETIARKKFECTSHHTYHHRY